jgi:two-component system, OmpR family, KDP operon response regulator KdpE
MILSPRVLIVEDDQYLNNLIHKSFRTASFIIFTATTLAKALDTLQKEQINLVVLDLGLPDAHGEEAVHRIRALKLAYERPRLVIITGRDPESLAPEIRQHVIMQKPLKLKELIRVALDQRHAQNI